MIYSEYFMGNSDRALNRPAPTALHSDINLEFVVVDVAIISVSFWFQIRVYK